MKTKAEILESKLDSLDHSINRELILEAMSEYAKQQAQEFAEWCEMNGWVFDKLRKKWFCVLHIGYKTTPELYTKFDEERGRG